MASVIPMSCGILLGFKLTKSLTVQRILDSVQRILLIIIYYFYNYLLYVNDLMTIEVQPFVRRFLQMVTYYMILINISSSLRPGFEGCSEIMNEPLYLRFVCLEQDEIFP